MTRHAKRWRNGPGPARGQVIPLVWLRYTNVSLLAVLKSAARCQRVFNLGRHRKVHLRLHFWFRPSHQTWMKNAVGGRISGWEQSVGSRGGVGVGWGGQADVSRVQSTFPSFHLSWFPSSSFIVSEKGTLTLPFGGTGSTLCPAGEMQMARCSAPPSSLTSPSFPSSIPN